MTNRQKPCVTQKHFEYTATVINRLRNRYPGANDALDEIVEELIPIYSNANERFKSDLFRESCGVLSCHGEDIANDE